MALRNKYFAPSTKKIFKTSQRKINGVQARGSGASSKIPRIDGTVIVRTRIAIAIIMAIFNLRLEKKEYEKSGRCRLLKEKAMTRM